MGTLMLQVLEPSRWRILKAILTLYSKFLTSYFLLPSFFCHCVKWVRAWVPCLGIKSHGLIASRSGVSNLRKNLLKSIDNLELSVIWAVLKASPVILNQLARSDPSFNLLVFVLLGNLLLDLLFCSFPNLTKITQINWYRNLTVNLHCIVKVIVLVVEP